MPVVGFVSGRSPGSDAYLVEGFRRGLRENGFTEGQNVALEFRWADGRHLRREIRQPGQFPGLRVRAGARPPVARRGAELITRAAVVAEAREWIGTPYHHQATQKGVGADCGGLVAGVAMALGIVPPTWWRDTFEPAFGGYGKQPFNGLLARVCESFMVRVHDEPAPGDVLLLDRKACECDMAAHGALAVRWGDGGVAQGGDGLVAVPMTSAVRAWRAA